MEAVAANAFWDSAEADRNAQPETRGWCYEGPQYVGPSQAHGIALPAANIRIGYERYSGRRAPA
jgi:hypothetical protein